VKYFSRMSRKLAHSTNMCFAVSGIPQGWQVGGGSGHSNVVVVDRSVVCIELDSERRMLWDDVLPRLRSRVQSLELDVQLVDVQHAGATSPADSHLDGHAHLSHLDMITACHRASCGTFFLVSNFRQALRDVCCCWCCCRCG